MNRLAICSIVFAIIVATLSIVIVVLNLYKTKRILKTLNEMLEAAIKGDFSETVFDESLLSAVETKMAQYLSSSQVSAKNLSEEKNKINELIADISHQTKTPLSNILLYAQLLKEQQLPEQSNCCIHALNEQAEKLSFLISSLVKASRLETGIFSLHASKHEIQPMLDNLSSQIHLKAADKNILLEITPTGESAYFDIKWTTEALYNIVDNAVKYTPEGGNISITVTPYNLFCRIDVIDTGIGISEEEHSKIFTRFYRSRHVSNIEGVGIGLYITRQILSNEGGYIKVSSKPGSGSIFSVFLPQEK